MLLRGLKKYLKRVQRNMCKGDAIKCKKIIKEFSDHTANKSHARHISKKKCEELGLTIESMETDQMLQDLLLSIHHSFMHTFTHSSAIKVIENHLGVAFVEAAPVPVTQQMVAGPGHLN